MSDVICPYCQAEQEINHDDGYGFDEGQQHEQDCVHCNKPFTFTTSISYHYRVQCQPGDHVFVPLAEDYPGIYECSRCDRVEKRSEADHGNKH